MKSDEMRSLARYLLKAAFQRYVYETSPDDYAQERVVVAEGALAHFQLRWAEVLAAEGNLADPAFREEVLNLLRDVLPEARAAIEELFEDVGFNCRTGIEAFEASFQPEAYLP